MLLEFGVWITIILVENNIKPLQIPAQSYKLILDRLNTLEVENKTLRKITKEKEIMILQKDQQISELQEIIQVG